MSKYAYPAVFTLEEDGTYSIIFPDLEGCYTCGDSLEDGIENGRGCFGSHPLWVRKRGARNPPKHLFLRLLQYPKMNLLILSPVIPWLTEKMYNNKAVKKKRLPFQSG